MSAVGCNVHSSGFILRVRPETLCRITEFSEHESNGRELDEGERVAVEVLPVLGQSAAAVEPGDGAFDHPTPGLRTSSCSSCGGDIRVRAMSARRIAMSTVQVLF